MKQIQIKPITKQISNVRISLSLYTEENKVISSVYYEDQMTSVNVVIEGAEYDAWGSDDNYIYDLILSKLGLEKA